MRRAQLLLIFGSFSCAFHASRSPARRPRARLEAALTEPLTSALAGGASVLTLTSVIVTHELGHLGVARALGIRVDDFSVGFGPPLKSWSLPDFNVTLRALPFGGFVAYPRAFTFEPSRPEPGARGRRRRERSSAAGEEADRRRKGRLVRVDGHDLYENRPALQRAAVLSGGVVANALSAFLTLSVMAGTVGIPQPTLPEGLQLAGGAGAVGGAVDVFVDGAASVAGLSRGDVIVAIDGRPLPVGRRAAVDAVVSAVSATSAARRDGDALTVSVVEPRGAETAPPRDVKLFDAVAKPAAPRASPLVGVSVAQHTPRYERAVAREPVARLGLASREFSRVARETVASMRAVASAVFAAPSDADAAAQGPAKVSGALGAARIGADAARASLRAVLPADAAAATTPLSAKASDGALAAFFAIVSINLAIVNLLPLPALDGGALALTLVDGVIGAAAAARARAAPSDTNEEEPQSRLSPVVYLAFNFVGFAVFGALALSKTIEELGQF